MCSNQSLEPPPFPLCDGQVVCCWRGDVYGSLVHSIYQSPTAIYWYLWNVLFELFFACCCIHSSLYLLQLCFQFRPYYTMNSRFSSSREDLVLLGYYGALVFHLVFGFRFWQLLWFIMASSWLIVVCYDLFYFVLVFTDCRAPPNIVAFQEGIVIHVAFSSIQLS